MPLPITIPNTFANATATIPLIQLDNNFATVAVAVNSIGNGAFTLANVQVTGGKIANVVLDNVSVDVETLSNVTINGLTVNGTANLANATVTFANSSVNNAVLVNSTATLGNATITLGSTTSNVGNLRLANVTITSGVVAANANVATSESVNNVGYMGVPQNSQNTGYNVVIGDAGKHLYHPVGQAAATYTIPANSNVAFGIGTAITFVNMSANAVTVAVTTDTIYLSSLGTTGNRTLAQYGIATAVKMTSDSWIISGSALT